MLDATSFAAELEANPVACLKVTPSHLEILAGEVGLDRLLPERLLIVAGEPFPARLAAALLAERRDLLVYNSYGPAETTVAVLMHRVVATDVTRERIPVGRAFGDATVRLLGPDGTEVDDGTPGVLWIGGASLARGYHGDPALTEDRFETRGGDRAYRTDDLLVRTAGGVLEFVGRADRQLKVRGYRVEPGEVEAALLALPGVRQAVVTGERSAPDAPTDLVAYVVAGARSSDLAGLLHGTLPAALVPSRIHVVPRIPVGANGKPDLTALAATVAAEQSATSGADLPKTDVERKIAGIWCTVLGRTEIGRHERFLEIGGDSFKLLAVFGRIRRDFPDIGIATLFARPTIAELAAALDTAGSSTGERPPATPAVSVVEL